ncbi:hypothetical protein KKH46_01485 [Patescibacteria group bacterium]|nr:hypothetical protein [Patescibacteria group bacterium]MBU1349656.1 hypothetical protein [Patescibacteria group bacterium]MBU1956397.1 hypothetical protein [Patescibacteria group bacterium]MBU2416772.1 hypothetical protein [Patescibacteria group bacterium]MBU2456986.1 hypothetical protein [Patescibacteria group bacterium]
MSWYRIAETSAEKASFLMLDLSYYPAFLELKKKTRMMEKFASYTDRKNNLVSEFMNNDDRDKKAVFGFKFFTNHKNFYQYKSDIKKIIESTNQYKKFVDTLNLYNISSYKFIDLFEKGKIIYHKALSTYLLSQPEYTASIENHIKDKLLMFVPKEEMEEIFIALISSTDKSCLEQERIDWLGNVILPATKKYKKFSSVKNDLNVFKKIKEHIKKYKYYSASVEFDLWDEKHYQKIMKDDFIRGYDKTLEEYLGIKNKTKYILKKRDGIVKKYKISSDILKVSKIVSELGLLRINLRILGWQFFNYLFPLLINISANKTKTPREMVNKLSYVEYIKFLKENKTLNIANRTKKSINTLVLITPKFGYEIFHGKSADKKFDLEIKEKIEKVQSFNGTVAYKRGVVQGNTFLFIWGSKDFNQRIYNFPKNAILVAGQTRPLLMPAIRKAKAIITDEGGLLCHAAIVSRELKIPCVVGTKIATKTLKDNDLIEVDTNTGIVKILRKNL